MPGLINRLFASSVRSSESHLRGIGRTSNTCVAARNGVPKVGPTWIPFNLLGCQDRAILARRVHPSDLLSIATRRPYPEDRYVSPSIRRSPPNMEDARMLPD